MMYNKFKGNYITKVALMILMLFLQNGHAIDEHNMNIQSGDFKIYDKQNRQSYICNEINPNVPPKPYVFKHIDNFHGIYIGIGIGQNEVNVAPYTKQNSLTSAMQSYTGSNMAPYLLLGNARVFSNGIYLGYEFSMQFGKSEISQNYADDRKVTFATENISFYTTRLGYLIADNTALFGLIGMGLPSTSVTFVDSSGSKETAGPDGFAIKAGVGLDISIKQNVRMLLEYHIWSLPQHSTSDITNGSEATLDYTVLQASLVWRF